MNITCTGRKINKKIIHKILGGEALVNFSGIPSRLRWLYDAASVNAMMAMCLENRTLKDSTSTSAGVIIENNSKTALIYLDVDLTWLTGMTLYRIWPEMSVDPTRLKENNAIVHTFNGEKMIDEFTYESTVDIKLQFDGNKLTCIKIPWLSKHFDLLVDIDHWIFMSHQSFIDPNQNTYFWAYGNFKNEDDIWQTVKRMIRMPYMPRMKS